MQNIIQMKANDAAKLQNAQSGGTTESIRRTHATAKPGSDRNRATTGEAGPARGPGNAAVPRGELPASRAQRDSHANRARLRREEEPREAELGNDGDLAQGGSEHDRAETLLHRSKLDFQTTYRLFCSKVWRSSQCSLLLRPNASFQ